MSTADFRYAYTPRVYCKSKNIRSLQSKSKCTLYIVHLIHRSIKILELEAFMPCKRATGFPQCEFSNYFSLVLDRLRRKGGITCVLVNQSLVWCDGRVVYALHSIDFFYCSPFTGGFTYFQGCSGSETDCYTRLSSPLISAGEGWKCLQFWYYIWRGQLKVLLVSNKTTSHTLRQKYYDSYWRLYRVNLSADFPYKVSTIKKSLLCLLL